MNREEYDKILAKHLRNIHRVYQQESKKLRFDITIRYIGEVIGREHDPELALDVLREATR